MLPESRQRRGRRRDVAGNVAGAIVLLLVLASCEGRPSDGTEAPGATSESHRSPATEAELSTMTFVGVGEDPVTLVDGHWEGEPFVEGGASRPMVGLSDFRLFGDVDDDGDDEAIVVLWTTSGGSGTFDYLAVVDRRPAGTLNLATAELGDRVKLRDARVTDGRIVLETLEAGPGDAMCCPGQRRRRTWELRGEELVEVANEDLGRED